MGNEARKRKIVEKSSDRLALISGRLGSLETPSPPSTPVSPRGKIANHEFTNLSRGQSIVKEAESSALDTTSSSSSNDKKLNSLKSKTPASSSCFSAKNINHCILSSEDTRVFCSITIAILVAIVKSESLIASRPLYVLLLSDIAIVLLRIAYARRLQEFGGIKDASRKNGEGDNWELAIVVLEWGLVFYQCVRAAFIDCSFYLVIVTCAFSFM